MAASRISFVTHAFQKQQDVAGFLKVKGFRMLLSNALAMVKLIYYVEYYIDIILLF